MPDLTQPIEKLIDQGRYFEALAKAEKALNLSENPRLMQLYALSLSKSGSPEEALEFIEPVYAKFPDDPESAGILGSICKELFKINQSTPFAIRSRDTYLKNFSTTKNFYTGINAASMSAMAGQAARSREIATEVISLLEVNPTGFWELASLGEAQMLTKNKQKSIEYYVEARKLAGNDWGKITSVYNQLWLLNHFLAVPNDILKLFAPPGVVAFAGHMIDHSGRTDPRFPADLEQKIKDALLHSIRSINAHIGYCSLACGSDILFAEAMAEEGGEVNIFIPFEKDDFIRMSVSFAGQKWVDRFTSLSERFSVSYITKKPYGGDDVFAFQSKIIFGSAALRSASYHAEPSLLTVLSETDLKRKEGGTRDTLQLWPYREHHININPDIFVSNRAPVTPLAGAVPTVERVFTERRVMYLVYCDFSEITPPEREKIYKGHDARKDSQLISRRYFEPDKTAVLAAFQSQAGAIEYVRLTLESMKLLRRFAAFKISLHAGPVDQESEGNFEDVQLSGDAVEVVKEINSVATKGSLFASDYFAALLALENRKFSINYGGIFVSANGERKTTLYKVDLLNA